MLAGGHLPPSYEHGTWNFAGSDARRRGFYVALPDRGLPAGEPLGQGGLLHPLIPYGSERWRALYRRRADESRM